MTLDLALLITLAVALPFAGGFAAGLWTGWKLWRQSYVRLSETGFYVPLGRRGRL